MSTTSYNWLKKAFNILRNVFHALWIFFPGILFLALTLVCFWNLSQGKDLMVLATEQKWFFLLFQLSLAFLVLVSWYAARIVGNAKKKSPRTAPGYLEDNYYKHMPRFIGFSFFSIIILAFAQTPIFDGFIGPGWLYFILLVLFIPYYFFLSNFFERRFKVIRINRLFWITITVIAVGSLLITVNIREYSWLVLLMLLVLQACFLILVVTRREVIQRQAMPGVASAKPVNQLAQKTAEMAKLPVEEINFNFMFLWICLAAMLIYIASTLSVSFAVSLGSFTFVLLAFGVFLAVGFLLSLLSIRVGLNIHFIILFFVYLFGQWSERHKVDLLQNEKTVPFNQRDSLRQYFDKWMQYRQADIDTASDYPVYFVLADGGASRSGYWVASVLSKLQDTSRNEFGKHLFCLSGASGGSVGNAAFYLLLKKLGNTPNARPNNNAYLTHARQYLCSDFLTYTLSRMLGHDFFVQLAPWSTKGDRAKALTQALELAPDDQSFLKDSISMNTPLSELASYRNDPNSARMPILCINTTRMQDGRPSVISTIYHDTETFNNRLDVLNVLAPHNDMKLSTAVVLGASFPYISPAGRIDEPAPQRENGKREHYFVDGGYTDNSGAGVVHEMLIKLQQWTTAAINDSRTDSLTRLRYSKLKFHVVHISNGPTGDKYVTGVNPFVNDLAAPLKTLFGSYIIQTTINDNRLSNFMNNIAPDRYHDINLFRKNESMKYSMNWVISRRTLDSMDARLQSEDINYYITSILGELKNGSRLQ